MQRMLPLGGRLPLQGMLSSILCRESAAPYMGGTSKMPWRQAQLRPSLLNSPCGS